MGCINQWFVVCCLKSKTAWRCHVLTCYIVDCKNTDGWLHLASVIMLGNSAQYGEIKWTNVSLKLMPWHPEVESLHTHGGDNGPEIKPILCEREGPLATARGFEYLLWIYLLFVQCPEPFATLCWDSCESFQWSDPAGLLQPLLYAGCWLLDSFLCRHQNCRILAYLSKEGSQGS